MDATNHGKFSPADRWLVGQASKLAGKFGIQLDVDECESGMPAGSEGIFKGVKGFLLAVAIVGAIVAAWKWFQWWRGEDEQSQSGSGTIFGNTEDAVWRDVTPKGGRR